MDLFSLNRTHTLHRDYVSYTYAYFWSKVRTQNYTLQRVFVGLGWTRYFVDKRYFFAARIGMANFEKHISVTGLKNEYNIHNGLYGELSFNYACFVTM